MNFRYLLESEGAVEQAKARHNFHTKANYYSTEHIHTDINKHAYKFPRNPFVWIFC